MSVVGPRNRMVYFRLSESEFQLLASLCNGAEGARSVSELSRSAVRRLLSEVRDGNVGNLGQTFQDVDRRFQELENRLEVVIQLLASRAPGTPGQVYIELPKGKRLENGVRIEGGRSSDE